MGINHDLALAILRSHPDQWIRPATNATLLSYLLLALKGYAIAVRDEDGYLFHVAGGRTQARSVSLESSAMTESVALMA